MAEIKIRRGASTELSGVTLALGELGYTTDTKLLYIGNGVSNTLVGAGILDEDNMSSDSDTNLATQQSIKSYVDNSNLIKFSDILISDSNLVDGIVYDTSLDSDGGLWRERCSNLSWYNEDLNTATRGSTRKFPKIALIIATTSSVTIYDATDPLIPMWMVFESNVSDMLDPSSAGSGNSSVIILNGKLVVGKNINYGGIIEIDFLFNEGVLRHATWHRKYAGGIEERNEAKGLIAVDVDSNFLVNHYVNDVASTVLDNAPIDLDTGLPLVTIGVATDGGVSVIDGAAGKGTVVDLTYSTNDFSGVAFDSSGSIYGYNSTTKTLHRWDTYTADRSASSEASYDENTIPAPWRTNSTLTNFKDPIINNGVGEVVIKKTETDGSDGITFLNEDKTTQANGSVDHCTTNSRTGDLVGDIRLASLMNANKVTNVIDPKFDNDGSAWGTTDPAVTYNTTSQKLDFTVSAGWKVVSNSGTVVAGRKYYIAYKIRDFVATGGIIVKLGSGNTWWNTGISKDGVHSGVYVAGGTGNISLEIEPAFAASLEWIDIREVEQIGTDITTETVSNPGLFTDTTGWVANDAGATLSAVSNNLRSTADDTSGPGMVVSPGLSVVTGETYEFNMNCDFTNHTQTNGLFYIGTVVNGGFELAEVTVVNGANKFTWVSSVTDTVYPMIKVNTGSIGEYIEVVSFSMKRSQNYINNPEFYKDLYWTKGTGWSISGGVASGAATSGLLEQPSIGLVQGNVYLVIFTISNYSSGNIKPYIGGSGGGTNRSANGTYLEVITMVGTDTLFFLGAFTGDIDDVEVYLLDIPDRCVKDNPLRVVGLLDLVPVAPFAELVDFQGYSANDYIEQPHTSDLDFGTGDFSAFGWADPTSLDSQAVFDKIDGAGRKFTFYFTNSEIRFYINGSLIAQIAFFTPLQFGFYGVRRLSGTLSIWFNGENIYELTNSTSVTFADTPFVFGKDGYDTIFTGGLSLWKISATAPSDDQILSTYNKEKKFFQNDAKITLQGTSNEVQSIDYDDVSQTTLVGTSDGVCKFKDIIVEYTPHPDQTSEDIIDVSHYNGVYAIATENELIMHIPEINARDRFNKVYSETDHDHSNYIQSDTNDSVTANTTWTDNSKIKFGTDEDWHLHFNGVDYYNQGFFHGARYLWLAEDTAGTNRDMLTLDPDGNSILYNAGAVVLTTKTGGVDINGDLSADSVTCDGIELKNSPDRSGLLEINRLATSGYSGVQIYHDDERYSLMGNSSTFGLFDDTDGVWVWTYNVDGSLSLMYGGNTKLETTSTGITVTGEVVADSFSIADIPVEEVLSRKNYIINGSGVIDQRWVGSSFTGSNYSFDRWRTYDSNTNTTTVYNTTNNTKQLTTASTFSSSDGYLQHFYRGVEGIEFREIHDKETVISFRLKTSATLQVCLSLWVTSWDGNSDGYMCTPIQTLTGATEEVVSFVIPSSDGDPTSNETFGGSFKIIFCETRSAWYGQTANTWSSTVDNTNAPSSLAGPASGTVIQISEVKWEEGDTRTPYIEPPYADQLARCQRYQVFDSFAVNFTSVDHAYMSWVVSLPVTMRTVPTVTIGTVSGSTATAKTLAAGNSSKSNLRYLIDNPAVSNNWWQSVAFEASADF